MDEVRAVFAENAAWALPICGLLIGLAFGFVVTRTNFCAMGGVSDMLTLGDTRRFKSWLLAIAIAMLGTQALVYVGLIDTGRSMYVATRLTWAGHALGGLMFGIGMVFAGGCASRNIARIGTGDLRALITLIVMGLIALMAVGGIFALPRLAAQQAWAIDMELVGQETTALGPAFAEQIGAAVGLDRAAGNLVLATLIAGLIALWCIADRRFRNSKVNIWAGVLIGFTIIAGWLVTNLAYDALSETLIPSASLTFVQPAGDLIDWLAHAASTGLPGFGASVVAGGILGAFFAARAMGRFRLQTFADTGDTVRTLFGACLMGLGGVTAQGCTVGQGLTGLSTLSAGSLISFVAIVSGAIIGVRLIEYMVLREAE